jgi:hypothetical protein
MCKHPDIKDFYTNTERHNAAGIRLVQGICQCKLGRWFTLTGFGNVGALGEDATVSGWMLSKTEKDKVCETTVTSGDIQLRGGRQLDMVIVDGWPEIEKPPSGPVGTWTSASGDKIAVKLIIAELGFTAAMSFAGTVTRNKRRKDSS